MLTITLCVALYLSGVLGEREGRAMNGNEDRPTDGRLDHEQAIDWREVQREHERRQREQRRKEREVMARAAKRRRQARQEVLVVTL